VSDILIAALSSVLALSTLVTAGVSRAASAVESREQLRRLKRVRVQDQLSNPTLAQLGETLVGGLGKTPLPSYVRDPQMRDEFRRTFNAIRAYVGTEAVPIDSARTSQSPGEPQDTGSDSESVVRVLDGLHTADGTAAVHALAGGETWNALARMRRALEMALASRLSEAGIVLGRGGAGSMLSLATRIGLLPAGSQGPLRHALQVANSAIHGEEARPDAALEAILTIDRALHELTGMP